MVVRLKYKVKCLFSGMVFTPYGFKMDAQGNITHVDTEPNMDHECWEDIKDFELLEEGV